MVVMGHFGAPFGVKGWAYVHPYTGGQGALLEYPVWWLGHESAGEWEAVEVAEADLHGSGLIVRLEGCSDREDAGRLKGMQVAVRRGDLPETGAGEHYWADLVGLGVVNTQGVHLGTVTGLIETGANDVLSVEGERLRLIPFVARVIEAVDYEAGRIVVDWGEDF